MLLQKNRYTLISRSMQSAEISCINHFGCGCAKLHLKAVYVENKRLNPLFYTERCRYGDGCINGTHCTFLHPFMVCRGVSPPPYEEVSPPPYEQHGHHDFFLESYKQLCESLQERNRQLRKLVGLRNRQLRNLRNRHSRKHGDELIGLRRGAHTPMM